MAPDGQHLNNCFSFIENIVMPLWQGKSIVYSTACSAVELLTQTFEWIQSNLKYLT